MEASEIIRRNEAIARYMGWQFANGAWWENDVAFPFSSDMLDFHSNWSRLMPVVEKILLATRGEMRMGFRNEDVCFEVFSPRMNYLAHGNGTMIEAVWMAVSDYCLSLEPSTGAGV